MGDLVLSSYSRRLDVFIVVLLLQRVNVIVIILGYMNIATVKEFKGFRVYLKEVLKVICLKP